MTQNHKLTSLQTSGRELVTPANVSSHTELVHYIEQLLASWKRHEHDVLEEQSPEDLCDFGAPWRSFTLREFLEGILAWAVNSRQSHGAPTWSDIAHLLEAGRNKESVKK